MLKFFLIFLGIAVIFCLYFIIKCLIAASCEYDLPSLEEVETGEITP